MAKTLILGLGNPVRSDDGVGIRVVEQLKGRLSPQVNLEIDIDWAGTAGLGILETIAGYDRLIVVDAIECGEEPGTVLKMGLSDLELRGTEHAFSSHEADFVTTLKLGAKLGLPLPTHISIVAVQVADVACFSEVCTPAVEKAIPKAIQVVLKSCAEHSS
ncbi:MAG: hydrogenase maturation protease [Proteobacteria bacterium]|nr:hydrogenase maturation protease [Pseudomonadota bacterium]